MPIYECHCVHCNENIEFFSGKVLDASERMCPHCNNPLQSRISLININSLVDSRGFPSDRKKVKEILKRRSREEAFSPSGIERRLKKIEKFQKI